MQLTYKAVPVSGGKAVAAGTMHAVKDCHNNTLERMVNFVIANRFEPDFPTEVKVEVKEGKRLHHSFTVTVKGR